MHNKIKMEVNVIKVSEEARDLRISVELIMHEYNHSFYE